MLARVYKEVREPHHHRLRSVPVWRRPLAAGVGKNGCASCRRRRTRGILALWSGRPTRGPSPWWVTSICGTDARHTLGQSRRQRTLGNVRARTCREAPTTSLRFSRSTAPRSPNADPYAFAHGAAAAHGVGHRASRRARLAGRGVDRGTAGARDCARRADGRVRSTRRIVAAQSRSRDSGRSDLARAGRGTRAVRPATWALRISS